MLQIIVDYRAQQQRNIRHYGATEFRLAGACLSRVGAMAFGANEAASGHKSLMLVGSHCFCPLITYPGVVVSLSARARDLIQQMLTFSRSRRGEPRTLALAPLIRESVKLLRSSLPATVALRTDLDDDAPPVLLDPVQLEQVPMNLAINARDAIRLRGRSRPGGVL